MNKSIPLNDFLIGRASTGARKFAKANIDLLRTSFGVSRMTVIQSAESIDKMYKYGATVSSPLDVAKVTIGRAVGIKQGDGFNPQMDAHMGISGHITLGTQVDAEVLPSTHVNYPDGVGDVATITAAEDLSTQRGRADLGIQIDGVTDVNFFPSNEGIRVQPDGNADKVIIKNAVIVNQPAFVAASATLLRADGTTTEGAIIRVTGSSWVAADQIAVNFLTNAVNGGTPVYAALGGEDQDAMAVGLAASLDAATNISASSTGGLVFVFASAAATTVTINSVTATIA